MSYCQLAMQVAEQSYSAYSILHVVRVTTVVSCNAPVALSLHSKCKVCDGKGKSGGGSKCSTCKGSGRSSFHKCFSCKGSGSK